MLELRRYLHHLTRMPDNVIRSIIADLVDNKLIVLKKVEGEKPKYDIDIDMIEKKILVLSVKQLNDFQRRYKISNE